jgi:predicted short-subunit dehydrogenase-like oxidoreductase (DUF2520 family)
MVWGSFIPESAIARNPFSASANRRCWYAQRAAGYGSADPQVLGGAAMAGSARNARMSRGRINHIMRLGIVGGGRAAWAFGSAWLRIGWPIAGVWLREESHSHIAELLSTSRVDIGDLARDAELLLVAVSDRSIKAVVTSIPETEAIIFHASGAMPSMRDGFSLHPLKTLPAVGEPSDLRDTLLVFEGNHRKTAKLIAKAMGARFAEITPEQKALYHAAAVFAANYVAALLDIAQQIMAGAGVGDVRTELADLARSAIDNWVAHEDDTRFTGPAARGDLETIRRHLNALRDQPRLADLYEILAEHIARQNLAAPK